MGNLTRASAATGNLTRASAATGNLTRASAATGKFVVGIDNGGTKNNATVLDADGTFLIADMIELPSRVLEGPAVAIDELVAVFDEVLSRVGIRRAQVAVVGLGTPGPASAEGVISSRGSTNFAHPEWFGFDIRTALQDKLGLPVVYINDANAAALYAHHTYFGPDAGSRSSVSAIVGTGLGGGLVEAGRVVSGASGMAGELGHVRIALDGLLEVGQPRPRCNCGAIGDAESIASLTGIMNNLLPYWLGRYPWHELHAARDPKEAAKRVRGLAERGDELAMAIFTQQAQAIGRLFSVAANFTDPAVYFVGGGVVESDPGFRHWFLEQVRENTVLRPEQAAVAEFATVPDRDMAGARGAALAAAYAGPDGPLWGRPGAGFEDQPRLTSRIAVHGG